MMLGKRRSKKMSGLPRIASWSTLFQPSSLASSTSSESSSSDRSDSSEAPPLSARTLQMLEDSFEKTPGKRSSHIRAWQQESELAAQPNPDRLGSVTQSSRKSPKPNRDEFGIELIELWSHPHSYLQKWFSTDEKVFDQAFLLIHHLRNLEEISEKPEELPWLISSLKDLLKSPSAPFDWDFIQHCNENPKFKQIDFPIRSLLELHRPRPCLVSLILLAYLHKLDPNEFDACLENSKELFDLCERSFHSDKYTSSRSSPAPQDPS